ncbi:GNAT family N-acetyltransferase [Sporosarcina sp. ACRSM]|uniref:GNAT family N-acetyltransferase n=1 Tax=Sporosarcina sp. ACRSM TaxID=2918216 RepID=UPI001EF441F5|nr:GNAT family N-acetyltransferase [Sporosarcina sp. ACRSM]MCG7336759.1 GNAT family N-acetyltransferase [Sporosarcina sp. ACRSM]
MHLQEWTMEEQEQLIHFMTTNTWPYHGNSHPGRELIEKAIEEGGYQSDEVKTFWVENDAREKVGIVKIYDLADKIPMFDLRIADMSRGNGYGPKALRLVAEYVFSLPDKKIRLEGHTRQDNLAMRKTFERAGFVKEAHLRNAWFSPKEYAYYDAVTYGITREDFTEGTTTPVIWEDGEKSRSSVKVRRIADFPSSLESERLLIRAPKLEDAEEVWEATRKSLTILRKWMPWAQPEPELETTKESLRKAVAQFITREDLRFHLYHKETGAFVGACGLHRIDWSIPKFEIGYWLSSEFEGYGYMTEAVQRIEHFAFEQLGAHRVEIRCDESNMKSRSVAERAGFTLEGILHQDSLSPDGNVLRNTCIYAKIG